VQQSSCRSPQKRAPGYHLTSRTELSELLFRHGGTHPTNGYSLQTEMTLLISGGLRTSKVWSLVISKVLSTTLSGRYIRAAWLLRKH
jgi:hypothetical protein